MNPYFSKLVPLLFGSCRITLLYLVINSFLNFTIMTRPTYQIGQIVNYTNGQPCIYTGTIVKIRVEKSGTYLIIIDDAAGMELWNAGIACGSDIHENQVIN